MARKPGIEYPGAVYHVMNRGDRGGKVFKDGLDYELFLKTRISAYMSRGSRTPNEAASPICDTLSSEQYKEKRTDPDIGYPDIAVQ